MAINPNSVRYGVTDLSVRNTVIQSVIGRRATHAGGTNGAAREADVSTTSITFSLSSTNAPMASQGQWGIALVEDGVDVVGDFTNAAGTALSSGVLAYKALGSSVEMLSPGSVTLADDSDALNPPLAKAGAFRVVLTSGPDATSARNASSVSTGPASTDYHYDSDGVSVFGGSRLVTHETDQDVVGWCGRRAVVDTLTIAGPADDMAYPDTPTLSAGLSPAVSGTEFINPKSVRMALSTDAAGGTVYKASDDVVSTSGAVSRGLLVDKGFANSAGDYYLQLGLNDVLGATATPAAQEPDLAAIADASPGGLVGLTSSQRSWIVIDSAGVGLTKESANRVRDGGATTIDPRAHVSGLTTTPTSGLANRGETATANFNLQNARNENLTASFDLELRDSQGSIKASASDTGDLYTISRSLAATDDASFDFVGAQWTIAASNPDTYAIEFDAIKVSRKLKHGSAAGLNDLTVVTEIAAGPDAGSAETIFARAETARLKAWVSYADGRAYDQPITLDVEDDLNAVEKTFAATLTGGQYNETYAIGVTDKAASTLNDGSAKHLEVSANGNSADSTGTTHKVSTARVIHSSATLTAGNPVNADNAVIAVTATSNDGGGGDRSLLNVLETCNVDYHVFGPSGRPWYLSLESLVIADNATTEDTQSKAPDSAGKVTLSYATANGDQSLADLTGSPKHVRVQSSDGNDTLNAADGWHLSRHVMQGSAVGSDDQWVTVNVGSAGGSDGTLGGFFDKAAFNRDSNESAVYVEIVLSFARGTAYATQTVTTEVHPDSGPAENVQNVATDANGKLAYTYSIGQTDKATDGGGDAKPSLSPKHLEIVHGDNLCGPSMEAWGVTKHVWLDAHDQRDATINKDDWNTAAPLDGSQNANEEPVNYVILGNELHFSVHARGVRLDRELQTTGSAVSQSVKKPNGTTHASQTTDTGADGWSPPWNAPFEGPESPNWKLTASLNFDGNNNTVEKLVAIASPLDSKFDIRVWAPTSARPGATVTIYLQCLEQQGAPARFIAQAPDTLPVIRIGRIVSGSPDTVEDGFDDVATVNVVDAGETINGALYRQTFTMPAVEGVFNVWGLAQIGGSPIKGQARITLAYPKVDHHAFIETGEIAQ